MKKGRTRVAYGPLEIVCLDPRLQRATTAEPPDQTRAEAAQQESAGGRDRGDPAEDVINLVGDDLIAGEVVKKEPVVDRPAAIAGVVIQVPERHDSPTAAIDVVDQRPSRWFSCTIESIGR